MVMANSLYIFQTGLNLDLPYSQVCSEALFLTSHVAADYDIDKKQAAAETSWLGLWTLSQLAIDTHKGWHSTAKEECMGPHKLALELHWLGCPCNVQNPLPG